MAWGRYHHHSTGLSCFTFQSHLDFTCHFTGKACSSSEMTNFSQGSLFIKVIQGALLTLPGSKAVYQQILCSTLVHSYISYRSGLLGWKYNPDSPLASLKPKRKGIFRPAHLIWPNLQKLSDFKSGSKLSFLHGRGHLDWVPTALLAAPRKVSLKQYQMGAHILTLIHAQWPPIYRCSVFWVFHWTNCPWDW